MYVTICIETWPLQRAPSGPLLPTYRGSAPTANCDRSLSRPDADLEAGLNRTPTSLRQISGGDFFASYKARYRADGDQRGRQPSVPASL